MAEKRWYLLNDGNFGYSIEHTEEANESGMSGRGGYSDYGTFSEAKKAMIECLKNDLKEARSRLASGRAVKKKDFVET